MQTVSETEINSRHVKLLVIVEGLPEVVTKSVGEKHLAFSVKKKTFAHYLHNHHGDGIIALSCKSTHDRRDELITANPVHYYAPDYTGPQGWVAIRLDLVQVDWPAVKELLFAAYRLQAPKRLAEQV